MYQSVFKDIWGSDLIFAGPHKTFTDFNKTSNINHVIFGIHSTIRESDCNDNLWTDEREYAIIADSELGLMLNPFPLNPEDIIDVGGWGILTSKSVLTVIIILWKIMNLVSRSISVVLTRLSSP